MEGEVIEGDIEIEDNDRGREGIVGNEVGMGLDIEKLINVIERELKVEDMNEKIKKIELKNEEGGEKERLYRKK